MWWGPLLSHEIFREQPKLPKTININFNIWLSGEPWTQSYQPDTGEHNHILQTDKKTKEKKRGKRGKRGKKDSLEEKALSLKVT